MTPATKWIIEVPGRSPVGGGRPSWVRHRRLKPETPEGDVRALLRELLGLHAAARATLGRVEIVSTHRGQWVKRMMEVTDAV